MLRGVWGSWRSFVSFGTRHLKNVHVKNKTILPISLLVRKRGLTHLLPPLFTIGLKNGTLTPADPSQLQLPALLSVIGCD